MRRSRPRPRLSRQAQNSAVETGGDFDSGSAGDGPSATSAVAVGQIGGTAAADGVVGVPGSGRRTEGAADLGPAMTNMRGKWGLPDDPKLRGPATGACGARIGGSAEHRVAGCDPNFRGWRQGRAEGPDRRVAEDRVAGCDRKFRGPVTGAGGGPGSVDLRSIGSPGATEGSAGRRRGRAEAPDRRIRGTSGRRVRHKVPQAGRPGPGRRERPKLPQTGRPGTRHW
jgi:hypothetical protein